MEKFCRMIVPRCTLNGSSTDAFPLLTYTHQPPPPTYTQECPKDLFQHANSDVSKNIPPMSGVYALSRRPGRFTLFRYTLNGTIELYTERRTIQVYTERKNSNALVDTERNKMMFYYDLKDTTEERKGKISFCLFHDLRTRFVQPLPLSVG